MKHLIAAFIALGIHGSPALAQSGDGKVIHKYEGFHLGYLPVELIYRDEQFHVVRDVRDEEPFSRNLYVTRVNLQVTDAGEGDWSGTGTRVYACAEYYGPCRFDSRQEPTRMIPEERVHFVVSKPFKLGRVSSFFRGYDHARSYSLWVDGRAIFLDETFRD